MSRQRVPGGQQPDSAAFLIRPEATANTASCSSPSPSPSPDRTLSLLSLRSRWSLPPSPRPHLFFASLRMACDLGEEPSKQGAGPRET